MNIEPSQHNNELDKVLAALRRAAQPEGMETRIVQRLQQAATPRHSSSAFSAAWWRGAVTGAAIATLAVCMTLLVQHVSQATAEHGSRAVPESATAHSAEPAVTPGTASARVVAAGESPATPCANPSVHRARSAVPAYTDRTLRYASFAPSHPAPVLPPTAQERALAELARTASPKVLASLDFATQSRMEAEQEAEFKKFFTPPPTPPQPEYSEPATQTNQDESQL